MNWIKDYNFSGANGLANLVEDKNLSGANDFVKNVDQNFSGAKLSAQ